MMKENEYKVAGYCFSDDRDYQEAKHDLETIDLIKAKTDLNDYNKVLKLYHKLVEHRTFKTAVGYSFLKMLQERILKKGIVSQTNLPLIPVQKLEVEIRSYTKTLMEEKDKKHKATYENYIIKLRNSRIISAFLVVIIIAMILISLYSNNNISSNKEENEILDRYASWKEELDLREKALDDREKELKELEDSND